MKKAHQGKYYPKNPKKYEGDVNNIFFRSSWELSVMLWCDTSEFIVSWSSEEISLPYLCPTDGRWHRYFIDFKIKSKDGKVTLVEVKPHRHTKRPNPNKRKTKAYVNEVYNHVKNKAKWKAAQDYALDKGWVFNVWTEKTLKKLGIKIMEK